MTAILETDLGGLTVRGPIMPASGTFSYEMGQLIDLNRLAAMVLKTTTYEARSGNLVPRVSEVHDGMLNSIGLPGGGLGSFISDVLPKYREYTSPIVASVSAGTATQFAEMVDALTQESVAAIELNISCPNIEEDGKAFAMSPRSTERVVEAARRASHLPLWVKLSPNVGDIAQIAASAESAGADALVVANTILAMSIDAETRMPSLGNLMGGLSGPSVKPIIMRMVYQCAQRVSIPVIGCGGVSTGIDVVEYLLAGASAVQVGTESFVDPLALERIEAEFVTYCEEHKLGSVTDLIGGMDDDGTGPNYE